MYFGFMQVDEKLGDLECSIFNELVEQLRAHREELQKINFVFAQLEVLLCFAQFSVYNSLC